MADDAQLKVSAIIDTSQASQGVSQFAGQVDAMAARINAAFGSIQQAPERVRNSFLVMNAEMRSGQATVASMTQWLASLDRVLPKVASSAGATASSITGMDRAMASATTRIAAMGGGVGGLGYALGRVAAQSQSLGPILALAFPVVAAGAVLDIVYRLLSAIPDLTDAYFGLDDVAKKAYQDIINQNAKLIVENAQAEIAVRNLNQIGLEGSKRWSQAIADTNDNLHTLGISSGELQRIINDTNANILQMQNGLTVVAAQYGTLHIPEKVYGFFTGTNNAIKQQQESLKSYQQALDEITKQEREMSQVTEKRNKDELNATAVKENSEAVKQVIREETRQRQEQLREEGRAVQQSADDFGRAYDLQLQAAVAAENRQIKAFEDEKKREVEAATKAAEEQKRVDDELLRSTLRSIEQQSAIREQRLQSESQLGEISPKQRLQAKQTALESETQAEIVALNKRAEQVRIAHQKAIDAAGPRSGNAPEINDGSVEALQRIEDQKIQVQQKYQLQSERLTEQLAAQQQSEWNTVFATINRPLASFTSTMLHGTENISLAFRRMGNQLLISTVSSLEQVALKWAEHWLIVNVLQKSALAQQLADIATGNAAKHAIQSAANVSSVIGSAGVAGAAAFASVMAALPFPINVATAPEVSAAALGEALSFTTIASQATGGFTTGTGLVMMHPNEVTMPADVSASFRRIMSANNNGIGGGHTFAFAPVVHAMDAEGVDRVLVKHQKIFQEHVRRWARNGAIG